MGPTERGIFERVAKTTNEQLLGVSPYPIARHVSYPNRHRANF